MEIASTLKCRSMLGRCRRILGHLQLLLLRRQRQRQLPAQGHNREYTRSFPTRERHRPKASDALSLCVNERAIPIERSSKGKLPSSIAVLNADGHVANVGLLLQEAGVMPGVAIGKPKIA